MSSDDVEDRQLPTGSLTFTLPKGLLTLCFDQAFMAVDGIGTVVSVLSGRVSNVWIVNRDVLLWF